MEDGVELQRLLKHEVWVRGRLVQHRLHVAADIWPGGRGAEGEGVVRDV